MCKKDYSWNPSTYICRISRYLKSIVNNSAIACDEIKNVVDSGNVTNTASISVTCTVLNSDNKKVRHKMDFIFCRRFY